MCIGIICLLGQAQGCECGENCTACGEFVFKSTYAPDPKPTKKPKGGKKK